MKLDSFCLMNNHIMLLLAALMEHSCHNWCQCAEVDVNIS